MTNFDAENIMLTVLPADKVGLLSDGEVDYKHWQEIQDLVREGYTSSLPERSPKEVDLLVDSSNLNTFRDAQVDPNFDVRRGRLPRNQKLAQPIVILATEGSYEGRLVGYSRSANRVFGRSDKSRDRKMSRPASREVLISEVVVAKDYRLRGLAHILASAHLDERHPKQPVAVDVWEEMRDFGSTMQTLGRLGFVGRPAEPRNPFPYGIPGPVKEVHLKAPSVNFLRKKLHRIPGFTDIAENINIYS